MNRVLQYLKRHWRGEFGLAHSYWVNVFIISSIFTILTRLFTASVPEGYSGPLQMTLYIMTVIAHLCTVVALVVWQVVGLWRSAKNHIAKTNRLFWARASQLVCVIVLFSLFVGSIEIAKLIPVYVDMLRYVVKSVGKYEITLLEDGKELSVLGTLEYGVSEDVEKVLSRNPDVWVIHLGSFGGRLSEGRKLADVIKRFQLATYTRSRCMSACAIAFVSGEQRILNKNASLGFHMFDASNLARMDASEREYYVAHKISREERYFIDAGISSEFIGKIYDTTNIDMWYPTVDELIHSGVVTHLYDGSNIIEAR